MLQIIAFVYGIVVLITGKFGLGKGRVARGTPARLAGLVLVVQPVLALGLGFGLAAANVEIERGVLLIIDIGLLITAFVVATLIARRGPTQEAGAMMAGPGRSPEPVRPAPVPPMQKPRPTPARLSRRRSTPRTQTQQRGGARPCPRGEVVAFGVCRRGLRALPILPRAERGRGLCHGQSAL